MFLFLTGKIYRIYYWAANQMPKKPYFDEYGPSANMDSWAQF